ncbi:hypothetical protein D3C87_1425910 [compost metagenome]
MYANVGRKKPADPCRGKCNGWSVILTAILRGGSGKGLVFENGVGGVLQAPWLLTFRANFVGLVMARLKVSKIQIIDL